MPYRTYIRAIYEKFGFLATWLPGQKLSVGDIGILKRGTFSREHSMKALGFDLDVDSSDAPIDLEHSSGSKIEFSADGNASASATGGASGLAAARIHFSETGGFVVRAVGCVEHYVVKGSELRRAILQARLSGLWRDDWVVIDRVYTSEGLTVMVCNSTTGALSLTAKVQSGPFDIASTALGVQASAWEGDITRIVAAKAVAPMYSSARYRSGVFRDDRLEPARLQLRSGEESAAQIVSVSLQDALDED